MTLLISHKKTHTNPYCITHTELPSFFNPLQRCFLPCHYQNEILCVCESFHIGYLWVQISCSTWMSDFFQDPPACFLFILCGTEFFIQFPSWASTVLPDLRIYVPSDGRQDLFLKLSDHAPVNVSTMPSISFLSCLQVIPLHYNKRVGN